MYNNETNCDLICVLSFISLLLLVCSKDFVNFIAALIKHLQERENKSPNREENKND